jgi:Ca2+-binding EF-hand superfamily protein
MTVSAIGQGAYMYPLYGMQKTDAENIVEKMLKNLDTDGDGSLSADEIGKAGKHAEFILGADANSDGTVTKDELLSAITKKMDNLDTNGDGVLSTDEINAGGSAAQKILKADSNGDGVVTKDELVADIEKNMSSHKAHSHQHGAGGIAGKIMDALDSSGDGSLSADEISNGTNLANFIEPADTNGDGVVTLQELIAHRVRLTISLDVKLPHKHWRGP